MVWPDNTSLTHQGNLTLVPHAGRHRGPASHSRPAAAAASPNCWSEQHNPPRRPPLDSQTCSLTGRSLPVNTTISRPRQASRLHLCCLLAFLFQHLCSVSYFVSVIHMGQKDTNDKLLKLEIGFPVALLQESYAFGCIS